MPSSSRALLVLLASALGGCAGGSGGPGASGGAGGNRASGGDRARSREAEKETAAVEAEKRASIKVATGVDRRVEASALTEEELAEFRRGWKYFLDHDPRWARARKDWLDRGGAA